jgi:hypothetical protein
MIGNDNSLTGGLVAAGFRPEFHRRPRRPPMARFEGSWAMPCAINRGVGIEAHLKGRNRPGRAPPAPSGTRRGIDEDASGGAEVDGSISVLKNDDLTPAKGRTHRRFRFLKHG